MHHQVLSGTKWNKIKRKKTLSIQCQLSEMSHIYVQREKNSAQATQNLSNTAKIQARLPKTVKNHKNIETLKQKIWLSKIEFLPDKPNSHKIVLFGKNYYVNRILQKE